METYLKQKLNLHKSIGKGGFGEVFQALNPRENKLIAIKIEEKKGDRKSISVLSYEFKIMKYLQGANGIPKIYRFFEDPNYRFLSMELLGHNLAKYQKLCKGKFSITV